MRQTRPVARRQDGFSLRLHPEEKTFWEQVAASMGTTSVASMLRQLVFSKARELGMEIPPFPTAKRPKKVARGRPSKAPSSKA